jgi:protocatechuate 3,4-dioxygenase, beta subunit
MAHRVSPRVQIAGYRRDDVEVDPPHLHPDYVATRTRSPRRPLLLLPHTLSEVTGPV